MILWIFLAVVFVAPLVGVYFFLIRSVDRYAPEPWWLVVCCLVWGAFGSILLASVGNFLGMEAIAAVLGRTSDDELVTHATATIVAPLIEEPAKALGLLAIYLFSRRRVYETHGPLSGMVYGGMIGLGFTFTEDISYIVAGAEAAGGAGFVGLLMVRTILLGFGHATFTAMTGLGFGLFVTMRSGWRWLMPVAGLVGGMVFHAGRNLFASFLMGEGIGLIFVLLLHFTVIGLFFALLVWLGLRDRKRVMVGLSEMVGVLITREEYDRIISPWLLLPGWNLFSLMGLPGGYFAARRKQLNLFKLAFIRHRQRHEPIDPAQPPVIDPVENEAIAAIQKANHEGVCLAPYPPAGVAAR